MTDDQRTRGRTRDRDRDHAGEPAPNPSRRRFLTAAGLAGAGAAAAVPLLGGDEAEALTPPQEQVASRYSLNDHVKRFYFLNSL